MWSRNNKGRTEEIEYKSENNELSAQTTTEFTRKS